MAKDLKSNNSAFFISLQTDTRQMEYQINEINFLISLAWAERGKDVGDPIPKIEKCCEGLRAPPTSQKSEN